MPISLAVLMAFTAAVLAASLCAVLWRRPRSAERPPIVTTVMEIPPAPLAVIPDRRLPEGSVFVGQLEVDQVVTVQTVTARYALRLIDPATSLFEAVRDGRQKDGTEAKARFQLFFSGTFLPGQGLRVDVFAPGGTMVYRKVRETTAEPVSFSTKVQRVLFSIPDGMRQAS